MKPLGTLVLMMAFVGMADAQCYRTSGCGSYSYAPTYSYYQPSYANVAYHTPYYDTYTNTAVVGKAYPVYLPLLSYTSLADDVRSYYTQKKATKDGYLEALREAAAEGLVGMTATPQPQPVPPVGPVPNPPPGVEPPRATVPSPPPPPPNPTPKTGVLQVGKILGTKCASCHNPETEPNHVNLSIDPNKIDGGTRNLCVVYCTDGSMPKKGEKLTQQEYDTLVAWAKSAAPTIAKNIPPAQPAKK